MNSARDLPFTRVQCEYCQGWSPGLQGDTYKVRDQTLIGLGWRWTLFAEWVCPTCLVAILDRKSPLLPAAFRQIH